MKIFGIMLVKNEADIIAATLDAARAWADRVYVLDNGSDDGTWEIVRGMADDIIVPWQQTWEPYSNALRAKVFEAFRAEASDNDWWCYKMDSDEIYVDDPRAFLAQVPVGYHVVQKRSIDYMLTPEDVAEFDYTGDFERDRARLRYFKSPAYVERRFFRHRDRLRWDPKRTAPTYVGADYPLPITVRHFQWRSPTQAQQRLDLRNAIPRDKRGKPFRHVTQTSWRDVLVPREKLLADDGTVDLTAIPLRRPVVERPWQNRLKRALSLCGILP